MILRGALDYARSGELLSLMVAHTGVSTERIVLDLRLVDSLDSTWMWEFETLKSRTRRASIVLSMCVRERTRVAGILQRAGFGPLFEVDESDF